MADGPTCSRPEVVRSHQLSTMEVFALLANVPSDFGPIGGPARGRPSLDEIRISSLLNARGFCIILR